MAEYQQLEHGIDPVVVNNIAYGKLAEGYRERTDSISIAKPFDRFCRMLLGPQVMDLGCGPGRDIETMLEFGLQPYGVDVCPEIIDIASTRIHKYLSEKNNPLKFLSSIDYKGDTVDDVVSSMFKIERMEDMPIGSPGFKPKSYAGVWAVTSFQHVPFNDASKVLSDVYTLLRPEGVFYVKTRSPFDDQPGDLMECLQTSNENQGNEFTRFFAYYKPESLMELMGSEGFKIIDTSKGKNGRIEIPKINNGRAGYKFWILAKK